MKKIVALVMCLAMLCSMGTAFAQSSDVFTPTFLLQKYMTMEECYATAENRELLVALAVYDLALQEVDAEHLKKAIKNNDVYVCKRSETVLSIMFFADGKGINLLYMPDGMIAMIETFKTQLSAKKSVQKLKDHGLLMSFEQVDGKKVNARMDNLFAE